MSASDYTQRGNIMIRPRLHLLIRACVSQGNGGVFVLPESFPDEASIDHGLYFPHAPCGALQRQGDDGLVG